MTDAESRLVGGLLWGGPVWEAAAVASPADLRDEKHRRVFRAVLDLAERRQEVTPQAVAAEMESRGSLNGDRAWFHRLTSIGSAAGVMEAAREVADLARRRKVWKAARNLLDRVETEDVDEAVSEAVSELLSDHDGSGLVDRDELRTRAWRWLADDSPPGVRAWPGLDLMVVPGTLCVVTGVPGSGKSTFVDCLAVNLVGKGWSVCTYAPESGPPERHLMEDLVHSHTGVEPSGELLGSAETENAVDLLSERVVWLDDRQVQTVTAIIARARAALHGCEQGLLVIDPWSHVADDRPPGMREDQHIAQALGELSRFARQANSAVVVVAHPRKLQRQAGSSNLFEVPTPYDIAGSAAWYNASDQALALWRDKAYEKRAPELVDVFVQKVRRQVWGTVGKTELRFRPDKRSYGKVTHVPY